jgi:hypothetical protein
VSLRRVPRWGTSKRQMSAEALAKLAIARENAKKPLLEGQDQGKGWGIVPAVD